MMEASGECTKEGGGGGTCEGGGTGPVSRPASRHRVFAP